MTWIIACSLPALTPPRPLFNGRSEILGVRTGVTLLVGRVLWREIDCHACSMKSRGGVGDEAQNWPRSMPLFSPLFWSGESCHLVELLSLVEFVLIFSMCLICSNVDRVAQGPP